MACLECFFTIAFLCGFRNSCYNQVVVTANLSTSSSSTSSGSHDVLTSSTSPPQTIIVEEDDDNNGNWIQLGNDIDGTGQLAGLLGYDVQLSGNGQRMIVSAPNNAGFAQVYEWLSSSSWNLMGGQTIQSGNNLGDYLGMSVDISNDGERIALSAPGYQFARNYMGYVLVYSWDSTSARWTQLGNSINSQQEIMGDYFGWQVSMSSVTGNRIAVGAPYFAKNAGRVYIFEFDGNTTNTWNLMGNPIEGQIEGEEFGFSVALSGDGLRIIVGAPGSRLDKNSIGRIRVFEWNILNSTWEQMGTDINVQGGGGGGDWSGRAVALSNDGSRIAVGAPYNDNENGWRAGIVNVLEWNKSDNAWIPMGDAILGESKIDKSGFSLSMNAEGNILAIGSQWNEGPRRCIFFNCGIRGRTGSVRVYKWNNNNDTKHAWVLLGEKINGERQGDRSGYSVSLSATGDRVAIGAPYNRGGALFSGHSRVYEYSTEYSSNESIVNWSFFKRLRYFCPRFFCD